VLKKISILVASVLVLSACASHKAVRVECDGALRPINRPVPVENPAVTRPSLPLKPASPPMSEAGHD